MTIAVQCPYCQAALAEMPERKMKCPACGQPIFVKSTPSDRAKRLMTQAQADAAEAAWSAHYEAERMRDRWALLEPMGVTRSDAYRAITRARGDERRALFEIAAACSQMQENPSKARLAAHLASEFAPSASERLFWARTATAHELRGMRGSGVAFARVTGADAACAVCATAAHRTGPTNDIDATKLIPPAECPRMKSGGACALHFSPVLPTDRLRGCG